MRLISILGLVLLLLGSAQRGLADTVLWDNGGPDGSDFYFSELNGEVFPGQQNAENFTLTGIGTVVTGLVWWGTYDDGAAPTAPPSPADDLFTIRFFESFFDLTPVVDPFIEIALSAVTRESTGVVGITPEGGEFEIFQYSAMFDAVALPLDVLLWLSIINDTTSDTANDWGWVTSGRPTDTSSFRLGGDGSNWLRNVNEDLAFRITGVVPLPGAIWFMLSGVAFLFGFRRRVGG